MCLQCCSGLRVVAYVQLARPTDEVNAKQSLQQHCGEHLVAAAVPADFVMLQSLPLSPAGKVMRSALPPPPWAAPPGSLPEPQPSAEAGAPVATRHPGMQQSGEGMQQSGEGLELWVMRTFMQVLRDPRLEPAANIFARGCDSLAAAEMARMLGIEPRLIHAFPTARSLAQHLARARRPGLAGGTQPWRTQAARLGDPASTMQQHGLPPPETQHAHRLHPLTADGALEHALQQGQGRAPDPARGGVLLLPGGQTMCCQPPLHLQAQEAGPPAKLRRLQSPAPAWQHGPAQQQHEPRSLPRPAPLAPAGQGVRRSAAEPAEPVARRSSSEGKAPPATPLWQVWMHECVDAAPVVLCQQRAQPLAATQPVVRPEPRSGPAPQADSTTRSAAASRRPCDTAGAVHVASSQGERCRLEATPPAELLPGWRTHVFACSHAGVVVCVQGDSGQLVWHATLPGRAEAGLIISSNLQVCMRLGQCMATPALLRSLLRTLRS